MPAYQPYAFSISSVQNYFSQLNTIAEKIAQDIDNTKTTYGKLWHTLAASEQEEIINETLIQPEITIKYYKANKTQNNESITSSTSPASATKAPKTNKNNNSRYNASSTESVDSSTALTHSKNHNETSPAQYAAVLSPTYAAGLQCYSYDKRNLHTYAQQVTGLKIIQDETIGAYRDEHSAPFSYRTRSQVNLLLYVPASTNSHKSETVGNRMCIKSSHTPQTAAVVQTESKNTNEPKALIKINTNGGKTKGFNPSITSATPKLPQPMPNENFDITDTCFAETAQLVQHTTSGSQLSVSTWSAASTDDEDDKALCMENVKLLYSESDMRKGFDFLNNW